MSIWDVGLPRLCGVLAIAAGTACKPIPTATVERAVPEIVLRMPGTSARGAALSAAPDGSLFLVTGEGLYRAGPDSASRWTRLTSEPVQAAVMVSPSASSAFVITFPGQIHRWTPTDGWHRVQTPVSDSVIVDYDWIHGVAIEALWARSDTDVYAAGWDGTVLHFDGATWTHEATPLMTEIGTDRTPGYSEGRIRTIAGDETNVYFSTASTVYTRIAAGRWEPIVSPPLESHHKCGLGAALAVARGVLWVAGGEQPCLFGRAPDGQWTDVSPRLAAFSPPGVRGGAAQADGSILLWAGSYGEGDVAVIQRENVRLLQFPELRWFSGAAAVGDYLYVAGMLGDTTVVGRVPHRVHDR